MGLATLDDDWTVNGIPLYTPTANKTTVEHDNIVSPDSGRAESGYMHIRWIRSDIRKVNMIWDKLTGDEKDYLVNLLQGKDFNFSWWDNGKKTMYGYCGKVTYTIDNSAQHSDGGGVYRNVQANVIEM